ncbi:hypothetical protein ABZ208_33070 [Streptomyces sp. NPDC006208]|uniref:hypothetical protein n=1 Tax=Streptomyces sp. NPDC006208 TaxID=3156734 RepID=UPI0033A9A5E3
MDEGKPGYAAPPAAGACHLYWRQVDSAHHYTLAGQEDCFLAFRGAQVQSAARAAEQLGTRAVAGVLGPLEAVHHGAGWSPSPRCGM